MDELRIIDTRPARSGPFSPPDGIDDYARWLRTQYQRSQATAPGSNAPVYYGTAQRVHQVMWQSKNGAVIWVMGPYARVALEVIEEVAQGPIAAEII